MAYRLTPLQVGLAVSVGVHAALLGVRVADPAAFDRLFRDSPLEVVLVNARSNDAPAQAKALAQANLAGGGEADNGLASSPLPPAPQNEAGDSVEETRRQAEQLLEDQKRLLAAARRRLAELPRPTPEDMQTPGGHAQAEQLQHQVQLLAQIEKRLRDDSVHPKRRYISPATREVTYARYYDALRHKIEDRGTRNFPEHRGRKLYGRLTMMIVVDARGHLIDAEVVESSGTRLLDKRAVAIVKAAAPFGAFTSRMRREAEQLVVHANFTFEGEGLRTSLMGSPGSP